MTDKTKAGDRRPIFRSNYALRLGVLFVVFLTVPVILYDQFRIADAEKNRLLLDNVEQQGDLVAEALRPQLAQFDAKTALTLYERLAALGHGRDISIKVLYRPAEEAVADRFFFVAAWPRVSADYLDAERERLLRSGILGNVPSTCEGNQSLGVRFTNPGGEEELLASLTPITTASGCWVVITSYSTGAIVNTSIGRPYWRTPVVQLAFFIYVAMAAVVVWLFIDAWRNLRGFETLARRIGRTGDSTVSFRKLNRIPELDNVAGEFDRMVSKLSDSADIIRQAAEENAHALKGPVAVIAQAVEPIKRASAVDDDKVRRAVTIIEQSVGRLDALVSTARRLDEMTAALVNPEREVIDLSDLLLRIADSYREMLIDRQLILEAEVERDLVLEGSPDLMESVFENLLDNAVSVSPAGGRIAIAARSRNGGIEVSVEDEGPGVAKEKLTEIFKRHFSDRSAAPDDGSAFAGTIHFGLGLWVVQRNVQAMGGEVHAENRDAGGFRVILSFPSCE